MDDPKLGYPARINNKDDCMPRPLPINPEPLFTEKPKKRKRHPNLNQTTIVVGVILLAFVLFSAALSAGGVTPTTPPTPIIGSTITVDMLSRSQPNVIGRVIDQDTGVTLTDATLKITSDNSLTIPWSSCNYGYFSVIGDENSKANYRIEVSAPGCIPQSIDGDAFFAPPQAWLIELSCPDRQ
jgi:hypothetical protein